MIENVAYFNMVRNLIFPRKNNCTLNIILGTYIIKAFEYFFRFYSKAIGSRIIALQCITLFDLLIFLIA